MTIESLRKSFNRIDKSITDPGDFIRPIVEDFAIFAYCSLVSASKEGRSNEALEDLKEKDPKLYDLAETGKKRYFEYLEKRYPSPKNEERIEYAIAEEGRHSHLRDMEKRFSLDLAISHADSCGLFEGQEKE